MRYKERKFYISVIFLAIILSAGIFLKFKNAETERKINIARNTLRDLINNRDAVNIMAEYLSLSKKRIEEGRNKSINGELEKIADELSAKKNLKKINFLSKKKDGLYNREDYEIKIEGIDVNTLTNFLYKLKTANLFIKISGFNFSISFENPSLLNASIVISYIY
ncbi:MAG: hypothetical protein N2999_01075 [Proteobacteria bacterium]|nr:hypothetical protein [Pseudomonadota bacterium]